MMLMPRSEVCFLVDSNKYVGQPQYVSTRPLIVSPGLEERDSQLQAANILNTYSHRYGWSGHQEGQDQPQYNRSVELQYSSITNLLSLSKNLFINICCMDFLKTNISIQICLLTCHFISFVVIRSDINLVGDNIHTGQFKYRSQICNVGYFTRWVKSIVEYVNILLVQILIQGKRRKKFLSNPLKDKENGKSSLFWITEFFFVTFPQFIINRNWTSIELAKPDWEEEEEEDLARRNLEDYNNAGSGSVQQVTINEVDTYGFWDQSLDIMPAMSR